MAIDFTGTANGRINYGSAAALDDLPSGSGFSFFCWIRPNATLATRYFACKGSTSVGWRFSTSSTGIMRLTVDYSVTNAQSTANNIFSNDAIWRCVGGSYDGTNAPKLYSGRHDVQLVETTYSSQTAPSGTYSGDASNNFTVGGIGTGQAWPGDQGWHVLYNRVLTLGEFQQLQGGIIPSGGLLVYGLPGIHGLSTHVDFSGNGNNGTITDGAVVADPPSSLPVFSGASAAPISIGSSSMSASGGITPAGTLNLQVNVGLSGGITPTGALDNQPTQSTIAVGGSITPTGDVVELSVGVDDFGGVLAPSGSLSLQITGYSIEGETGEALAGSLAPEGTLKLMVIKQFGGSITPTGDVIHPTERIELGGGITPAGSLVNALVSPGIGFRKHMLYLFLLEDDD